MLARRCLECHSGLKPKGGLDLTTLEAQRKGGKSGPILSPGQSEGNPLWLLVEAGEMPPNKSLPVSEKAILKNGIDSGAPWGVSPIDHLPGTTDSRAGLDWWSLQPVHRPPAPAVADLAWPRNPIDRFVLARLEHSGLKPSNEADRRTLIRRLHFDLVGLPPTPEQVEAFVDDPHPMAYEALVDRLLASPHHGERWGRHWLDVVRYGESDGFERNGCSSLCYRHFHAARGNSIGSSVRI